MNNNNNLGETTESSDGPARVRALFAAARESAGAGDTVGARRLLEEAAALPLDPMGRWITQRALEDDEAAANPGPLLELWEAHYRGDMAAFSGLMAAAAERARSAVGHRYSQGELALLEAHLEEMPPGPDKIRARLAVASAHTTHARWPQAEQHGRRALVEAEENGDAALLATALNHFAQLLQETNRHAEAEPLLRRALAIHEVSLGPNHPDVATDLINLAQLLQATNLREVTEALMRGAITIDEALSGSDHANVATDLNNQAQLIEKRNRRAGAERLMRRALEIYVVSTTATGHLHPHLLDAVHNLFDLLEQMGDTEEESIQKVAAILAPVRDKLPAS